MTKGPPATGSAIFYIATKAVFALWIYRVAGFHRAFGLQNSPVDERQRLWLCGRTPGTESTWWVQAGLQRLRLIGGLCQLIAGSATRLPMSPGAGRA